jgi:hypothetical protein
MPDPRVDIDTYCIKTETIKEIMEEAGASETTVFTKLHRVNR